MPGRDVPRDAAEAIGRIRSVLASRSYHRRDRVATEIGAAIDSIVSDLEAIVDRLDELVADIDDEVDVLLEALMHFLMGAAVGSNDDGLRSGSGGPVFAEVVVRACDDGTTRHLRLV